MKNIKKIIALGLMVSLIMVSLLGCASDKGPEANQEEGNNIKEKINITYVKSPLNVPTIIQEDKQLFEEAFEGKTAFSWHEITAGPDQTNALAAGELDILHALGGTSAILAAANGVDLTITNIYSRAPKGFMLIAINEDIEEIADLKDKKVGGPKGTVLHQLLGTALATEGMTQKDVEFISMGIPEAQAALANGSIDVAMVAGPNALQALNNGAHIVTTGEGLVDGTIVTAVSKDLLENYPQMVKTVIQAHKATLDYIDENFDEVMALTGEKVGLTADETKEMFTWYDFNPTITAEDIEELKKTQQFLIDQGLQENEIDIEQIIMK